jgi:hypothetical protein
MQSSCCKVINICIFGIFIGFLPLKSLSDLDEDSIFSEARKNASMLDVQLAIIQRSWWTNYVISPNNEVKTRFPFITRVGMGIELEYSNGDYIIAKGLITNVKEFLKLTEDQKKLLTKNTLNVLRGHLLSSGKLVDKKSGVDSGKFIENKHIKLIIMLDGIVKNNQNDSIQLLLPYSMGVGQAGYANGQFVYSNPYYLKLRVINEQAVAGDKNSFIIEQE